MYERGRQADVGELIARQFCGQVVPPAVLLEQRVLELEGIGLSDAEEEPGIPSSLRQYAIASLQHSKPEYFVTFDGDLLAARDVLEPRYGLVILSVQEAVLLLQPGGGPVD
jgi:hypothetical protein